MDGFSLFAATVADDDRRSRQGDYRLARIAVACGLAVIVGILLLIDALDERYVIQTTTLTIMVTTIAVLLGVETVSIWRGGR